MQEQPQQRSRASVKPTRYDDEEHAQYRILKPTMTDGSCRCCHDVAANKAPRTGCVQEEARCGVYAVHDAQLLVNAVDAAKKEEKAAKRAAVKAANQAAALATAKLQAEPVVAEVDGVRLFTSHRNWTGYRGVSYDRERSLTRGMKERAASKCFKAACGGVVLGRYATAVLAAKAYADYVAMRPEEDPHKSGPKRARANDTQDTQAELEAYAAAIELSTGAAPPPLANTASATGYLGVRHFPERKPSKRDGVHRPFQAMTDKHGALGWFASAEEAATAISTHKLLLEKRAEEEEDEKLDPVYHDGVRLHRSALNATGFLGVVKIKKRALGNYKCPYQAQYQVKGKSPLP